MSQERMWSDLNVCMNRIQANLDTIDNYSSVYDSRDTAINDLDVDMQKLHRQVISTDRLMKRTQIKIDQSVKMLLSTDDLETKLLKGCLESIRSQADAQFEQLMSLTKKGPHAVNE